jgi:hypothetical protein
VDVLRYGIRACTSWTAANDSLSQMRVRLRAPLVAPPSRTSITRRILVLGAVPAGADRAPSPACTQQPSRSSVLTASTSAGAGAVTDTDGRSTAAAGVPERRAAAGRPKHEASAATGPIPPKIARIVCSYKRIHSYAALEAEVRCEAIVTNCGADPRTFACQEEYLNSLAKAGAKTEPTSGDDLEFARDVLETTQHV